MHACMRRREYQRGARGLKGWVKAGVFLNLSHAKFYLNGTTPNGNPGFFQLSLNRMNKDAHIPIRLVFHTTV